MKPGDYVIANPSKFTYVQAYRNLLKELEKQELAEPDRIRVAPLLDLNYPRTEVANVERGYDQHGKLYFSMQVNLMGLYGSLSPLPKFVTEELLQAVSRDEWGAKLFLDVIHQHLFGLLYRAQTRYLPHYQTPKSITNQHMILSLGGLSNSPWFAAFPDKAFILRNINVFRHRRGTVNGLKQLLGGLFQVKRVSVSQCEERHIAMPKSQQLKLSNNAKCLGQTSILGHRLLDVEGKLTVMLDGVTKRIFNQWLMSPEHRHTLAEMIREFVGTPAIIWLSLKIVPESTTIIDHYQCLGLNTWLDGGISGKSAKQASVRLL